MESGNQFIPQWNGLELGRPSQRMKMPAKQLITYHRIRQVFLAFYSLLVLFFLSYLAGARISRGKDGFNQYVKHFTYWSLTTQLLFYAGAAFFLLLDLVYGVDLYMNIFLVFFFWIPFGVVSLVFWNMPLLLYQNPGIVLGQMKSLHGTYEDGMVLVANYAYHYAPMALLYFFAIVAFPELERAYSWANDRVFPSLKNSTDSTPVAWRLIYASFYIFFPIILFMIYHVFFNYEDIYNVDIPEYGAVIFGLVVVFLFLSVPVVLLTFYHSVGPKSGVINRQ